MARLETAVMLLEGLEEHPATQAWLQLRRGGVPSEIRILKERSKGIRKSAVYWLDKADPDGRPVIAKRARRSSAEVEALIYQDVLPTAGLPAPAFHGMVDEGQPFCWLFMEYVVGERYSPVDPDHRRLAGRWTARLHGGSASMRRRDGMPSLGMGHYLDGLRAARDVLVEHHADPSLSPPDASTLQRLGALLDEVESSWPIVHSVCSELPETLVHGDLVGKNLRVAEGPDMVAFDWEKAGWGPPSVDLAQYLLSERFSANACLETYRATGWPGTTMSRECIQRQAAAGTILRCLTAIGWSSRSLGPPWHECDAGARQDFLEKRPKTLSFMEVYLAWLERSWQALTEKVGR